MPKLRTVVAQQQAGRTNQFQQRARASDFGGGQGLTQAGKAAGQLGATLKKQQLTKDKLAADEFISQVESDMAQQTLNEVDASAPGAPELVDRVKANANNFEAYALDGVPTSMKDYTKSRFVNIKQQSTIGAMKTQATMEGAQRRTSFKNITGNYEEVVTKDPTQLAAAVKAIRNAGDVFPEATRQAEVDAAVNKLGAKAFDRTASGIRDANGAAGLLKELTETNKWSDVMSPNTHAKAVSQMQKEVIRQDDLAKTADKNNLVDSLNAYAVTGNENLRPDLSKEQAVALAKTPSEAERIGKLYDDNIGVGDARQSFKGLSKEGIADQVTFYQDVLDNTDDPNEANTAARQLDAAIRASKALDTALKKDGALYLMTENPDIKAEYDAMTEAMKTNDPEAHKQAVTGYTEKLDAEYERMGVHPADRNLMPESQAVEFGKSIADLATSADKPQEVADRLAAEAARWGSQWPNVQRQLEKGGHLSSAQAVASRLGGSPVAVRVLEAGAVSQTEWNTALKTKPSQTNNDLDAVLADTEAALRNGGMGMVQYTRTKEAVKSLGQFYAKTEGTSVVDGMTRAKAELVDAFATLVNDGNGGYHIPKQALQQPYAQQDIERGARNARGVGLADIEAPADGDVEAFRSTVSQTGRWVPSGGGLGLTLTASGKQIYRKRPEGFREGTDKDVPYELTWEELRLQGSSPTPQQVNVRAAAERRRQQEKADRAQIAKAQANKAKK